MIASVAVIALYFAQAEPAPPEQAVPAPSTPPAVPAPPAPPTAAPPAAPAPVAPPVAAPEPPVPDALNTACLFAGLGYRLGTVLEPAAGFSIGGAFERGYASPSPIVDLGWAVEFLFDRFARSVRDTPTSPSLTRTITDTSFAALQTLRAGAGPLHASIAAGAGLSVAFFASDEMALAQSSGSAYQPFARARVAVDIAVNAQTAVGVRASYSLMLISSSVALASGQTTHLMGDLLDIHAGLFYRFR
ncbi:MAG TPA: hypothetical protein VFH68_22515 [Polyangia bacterium]|jgi:hypothetical protein|nr:hypothetical protein [Polyangia bacterium]